MLALDGPARAWEPQTAAACACLTAGRLVRGRTAPPAASRRDLALGHPDHHRDHPPASPRPRLTSTKPLSRPGMTTPGPVEPVVGSGDGGIGCGYLSRRSSAQTLNGVGRSGIGQCLQTGFERPQIGFRSHGHSAALQALAVVLGDENSQGRVVALIGRDRWVLPRRSLPATAIFGLIPL